jgi:hypothetical protein
MLEISSSIIINDVEYVEYVEPDSVRVLLRYLYGQNIDDAIKVTGIYKVIGIYEVIGICHQLIVS